jgi:uncharacterized protein YkwD
MSHSELPHEGLAARRATRLLAAALATVAVLGASTITGEAFAGACKHRNTEANQLSQHTSARTTLCLLNAERRAKGLSPLDLSRSLSQAASGHSHDMVARRYFAHNAPGGPSLLTRARRSGYLKSSHRWQVGENIAWGVPGRSSAGAIVRAWMHSPPHRKEILTPSYRQVGIGVAGGVPSTDAADGSTFTADFGVRH